MPGTMELLIIAGVVILLFGSKKLPDAARSMGRSLRIFKSEVKELREEEVKPSVIDSPAPVEKSETKAPSSESTS